MLRFTYESIDILKRPCFSTFTLLTSPPFAFVEPLQKIATSPNETAQATCHSIIPKCVSRTETRRSRGSRRITRRVPPLQRGALWRSYRSGRPDFCSREHHPRFPPSPRFSAGDFSLNYAYQWRVHAAAVIADGQVFIKPRSARRIYTPGGITNTIVWPSNDGHCASKRMHMGHGDTATDKETRTGWTEKERQWHRDGGTLRGVTRILI